MSNDVKTVQMMSKPFKTVQTMSKPIKIILKFRPIRNRKIVSMSES